ncbi:MAG: BrnA antitoxin family protein [Burkholderiaceae bacterium]
MIGTEGSLCCINPSVSDTKTPWVDLDEEPELTQEWFDSAEVVRGGKVVRAGRPPSDNSKVSVTIRLDADVAAWLRDSGPGWQTRVNEALRALRRLSRPETAE